VGAGVSLDRLDRLLHQHRYSRKLIFFGKIHLLPHRFHTCFSQCLRLGCCHKCHQRRVVLGQGRQVDVLVALLQHMREAVARQMGRWTEADLLDSWVGAIETSYRRKHDEVGK